MKRTLGALLTMAALVACDSGKGHKISVQKNLQTQAQQTSEWAADTSLYTKDEKGKVTCFKLNRLMELVEKLNDTVMVVHPNDLSFGQYVADSKGSTDDIYKALVDDLTPQMTNYFLKGSRRETLLEIGPAKSLIGSAQVGHLLNLTAQQECTAVLFKNGDKFNIEATGSKNGIRMISQDGRERRAYTITGKGHQVQVTVTRVERDVPECATGVAERLVRRAYLITPADELSAIQLKGPLADLVDKAVFGKTSSTPAPKAVDKGGRANGRFQGRSISFATWNYAMTLVQNAGGKLKDVTCSVK